jgi:hypothetical protein
MIIERDGDKCSHCGDSVVIGGCPNDDSKINLDHIIPLSRGGHDAPHNIQILCRKCNNKKGNRVTPRDHDKALSLMPSDLELTIMKVNKEPNKANKSGVEGVFFDRSKEKWISRIESGGKRVELCQSKDMTRAIEIRKAAENMISLGVSVSDLKERIGEKYAK